MNSRHSRHPSIDRAASFAERLGLRVPVMLAPMAGACPPSLSIAVCEAGGLGACGALLMSPEEIQRWAGDVRAQTGGPFQMNIWVPDPEPPRDAEQESRLRQFLHPWQLAMEECAPHAGRGEGRAAVVLNFDEQCEAMLATEPAAISSIMGLFPEAMVADMKRRGIVWMATATTVAEAVTAVHAGADVIVAQGMEAGGHRGSFVAAEAEQSLVGLMSLLPAIVDEVDVPVVATGGIADARGAAAALLLGASAVQLGTGFLRTTESSISPAWAQAIARTRPEDTVATRSFTGRLGRAVRNRYLESAMGADAPSPAPFPVQSRLTQGMRQAATRADNIDAMQAWAGQSARLSRAVPAAQIVDELWQGMQTLLG
ncbi:MAG: nitronate monooxygenase [Granulosicoccus sp.]|nr:nitronate monooxygenase [Granulosicoccus sp.]